MPVRVTQKGGGVVLTGGNVHTMEIVDSAQRALLK